MMTTEETSTSNDFIFKFIGLKRAQFTGQFVLKTSKQEWTFYIYLGRILYATGGTHLVRRWQRNLMAHCPQITPHQLKLLTISSSSIAAFNITWEYKFLYLWVQQNQITREKAAQIIEAIVVEVLFDVTQAIQVTCEVKPENLTFPQLVFLDIAQVIAKVQQGWQTWQKAKIADRSPNRTPVIKQPEQLQQQVSSRTYRTLTKLLDGQSTLRDIALTAERDLVEVTCSLLPYIQAGFVELIEITDLPAPIAPTAPKVEPPPANPQETLVACVDDNPLVCQTMEKILTTAGYQFLAVEDSVNAIATLLTRKPGLIFLNLVMPNTNGCEICTSLRNNSVFRNTPIIILTENDGIMDRVRAKLAGSSGFLSKPVNSETVLEVARAHLNTSASVLS